jgi:hypothetical protein
MASTHDRFDRPSRRDFIKIAGAGAGVLIGGGTIYAHHHPRPMPQSLPYLDQRMYFNNMELHGHVPAPGRSGGGQLMAIGSQRFFAGI